MVYQSLFIFLSISIYYTSKNKYQNSPQTSNNSFYNLTKNLTLQQQQYSSTAEHLTDYLNELAVIYKESSVNNYLFITIVWKNML